MSCLPVTMVFVYPPYVQIIYFGLCLLLALCGMNRKMGFWGYLFFSVVFSPLLGLIVLLVSGKKRSKEKLKPKKA
ncbi:Membrane protein [Candidatus Desulfarcum epimagneticum]|uniref:Membrane protein n=1 Tax=uncultured Desulfobacteraceae bacterium TaxID=218296 RepID=A0A484HDD6_9BACT|nr:Membrane protein [uncultured Desulfobacteraceae bacterium]